MRYLYLDLEKFRENRFHWEAYFDPIPGTRLPDFRTNTHFLRAFSRMPVAGVGNATTTSRPDYESWLVWGRTDLWWALLLYNGMKLTDLVPGVSYRYFSLGDYEALVYDFALKERDFRRKYAR